MVAGRYKAPSPADDWQSPTLVLIQGTGMGTWHISCALPTDEQPWPDAMVTGYTDQLAEAKRRVCLGLEWAGLLGKDNSRTSG